MGSSKTGTIIGIIVSFLITLALGFGLLYAASLAILPLVGPGFVPAPVAAVFASSPILEQLRMVYADFLLNILSVYILAPVVWLVGGLIAGLITRDMMKGAAAGLIAAIIAPFACWLITWGVLYYPDFAALVNATMISSLLGWVINGILAGIIAAVGGVIGGTLTSQLETR
jgi:hypothetical protein